MIKKIVIEIKGTEFGLTIEELKDLKRNIEMLIPPTNTHYAAHPMRWHDWIKMNDHNDIGVQND